jgi:hypothetical protein
MSGVCFGKMKIFFEKGQDASLFLKDISGFQRKRTADTAPQP